MSDERWDKPMTLADFFRLRPDEKKLRVITSYSRKVMLLEQLARTDDGYASIERELYKDRTALRSWHDEERKLWPWSDRLIDRPEGDNHELWRRHMAAIKALDIRRKGKYGHLENRVAELERIVDELERQNLALMSQLERAQKYAVAPQIEGR